jgi:hypothetical protein
MKITRKLKYFLENFDFLSVYNSPFRPPRPRLYIGKVAIGTPYFLPRKWVRYTDDDAIKATIESMNDPKKITQSFDTWYNSYKRYRKAIPRKIGFDFVSMGWKTKWSDTDYRFEWSPVWSFVFFKWQIAITFVAPEMHHYWECWLFYTRNTDKTKSIEDRIAQCRKEFPCKWNSTENGVKTTTCYWDVILKDKWL